MLNYSPKHRAYSLLELIIVIAILSIGIVIVLQALSYTVRMTGLSRDIIKAVFFLEDKMQELEFKEKQNIIGEEPKEVKDKKDKFSWEYTLNLVPDLNLYRLDFNIIWPRENRLEKIDLNTYLR